MKRFGGLSFLLAVWLSVTLPLQLKATPCTDINSVEDFLGMTSQACYVITQDLDFKGFEWTARPALSDIHLDGQNHRLLNIHIEAQDALVGVFTELTHSTVRNLRFENVRVVSFFDSETLEYATGGLVARAFNSQFISIHVHGLNVQGVSTVGGLIGHGHRLTIQDVSLHGSVQGHSVVGGVVAYHAGQDVTEPSVNGISDFERLQLSLTLEVDFIGAGVIAMVSGDDCLQFSQLVLNLSAKAEEGLGWLLGEVMESTIILSDVWVQTEVQSPPEGAPSLVFAMYPNHTQTNRLDMRRVIVLGAWEDDAPSPYSPYLQFNEEDLKTLEFIDVFHDERLNFSSTGIALSAAVLSAETTFEHFDFETVWMFVDGQAYPTLSFAHIQVLSVDQTQTTMQWIERGLWFDTAIPEPLAGYRFEGWFIDENRKTLYTPQRLWVDTQLYAQRRALDNPPTSITIVVVALEPMVQTVLTPQTHRPALASQTPALEPPALESETLDTQPSVPPLESTPTPPGPVLLAGEALFPWWLWWVVILALAVVFAWWWQRERRR